MGRAVCAGIAGVPFDDPDDGVLVVAFRPALSFAAYGVGHSQTDQFCSFRRFAE